MFLTKKILQYVLLMRLDKPIGLLLLLWPTLWALWLATNGHPHPRIVAIFVLGVLFMRSAGCILNDLADRHFDGFVKRTQNRPLIAGKVSLLEAILLASFLILLAFILVLQCNRLTIQLSFVALLLAWIYPFLKRFTHLPQLGLGLAFSFGVPMAFAAELNELPASCFLLFITASIWPIIYDTMYAMVDRDDDLRIGVKSTAILFHSNDNLFIGLLQLLFLFLLYGVGQVFNLKLIYYWSIAVCAILFFYQQCLIKDAIPKKCFKAFLNNNWVGASIFLGIILQYL
jgi:4-hydroxybenzoate polyprenyltransferase